MIERRMEAEMSDDEKAIIGIYRTVKSELISWVAFRKRAEPLLDKLEELLFERERLKAILEKENRPITEEDCLQTSHRHSSANN
jgi:hypothetical protein